MFFSEPFLDFYNIGTLSSEWQPNQEHKRKGISPLCKVRGEPLLRKPLHSKRSGDREIETDRDRGSRAVRRDKGETNGAGGQGDAEGENATRGAGNAHLIHGSS